jgi:hypothetical protein
MAQRPFFARSGPATGSRDTGIERGPVGREVASMSTGTRPPSAPGVLVAGGGADLRELMERMGHSTTPAALVYLHGGENVSGLRSGHPRMAAQAADLRFYAEPPIGIEPMTYSLRVNRSAD